jgi:hypothetical protein
VPRRRSRWRRPGPQRRLRVGGTRILSRNHCRPEEPVAAGSRSGEEVRCHGRPMIPSRGVWWPCPSLTTARVHRGWAEDLRLDWAAPTTPSPCLIAKLAASTRASDRVTAARRRPRSGARICRDACDRGSEYRAGGGKSSVPRAPLCPPGRSGGHVVGRGRRRELGHRPVTS